MSTGNWIVLVGAALGALQVAVLFIVSDLRERIMRLESGRMYEGD